MTDRCAIALGLAVVTALTGAGENLGKTQIRFDHSECQAPAQQQSPNAARRQGQGDRDFSRCGGVVKPPRSGDQAIEHPAPETGTTPVIPPSDIPRQQLDPGEPM
ncbi:hypothetical protein ATY81_25475 [Rhizobium sp. R72]|uniref:hypothetical protein n=1 Tax=unclassified Rhizobium TaxID=2613769 RepID=UPI000B52D9D9|nr:MULTISPECIES: hypothetical protein [unclassified Rhizobium]OWW00143.1 hypothetical protein ATY81_25475 [Rhizobium sp. R72]OWW00534.1 hypothetical protein ATY80_25475 [Rhizobium sp. R711]